MPRAFLVFASVVPFLLVVFPCRGANLFSSVLPPPPFRAGRLKAESIGLDLGLYDDPRWAESWHSKTAEGAFGRSLGLNYTRSLNAVQASFAIEKILMADPSNKQRHLNILDLGAGGGYMGLTLSDTPGWSVLAVDQAKATVDATARHVQKVRKDQAVKVVVGDHTRLPVDDASQDAVLAFNVFEQIGDLQTAFREIHRVLKPGGALVFGTVNRSIWAWMSEVLLSERLFGTIPPGLQDWRLFITPSEMKQYLETSGFGMLHEDLTGLCERPTFKFDKQRITRTLAYVPCSSLAGHYMSWATKVKGSPLSIDPEAAVENEAFVSASLDEDEFHDAEEEL